MRPSSPPASSPVIVAHWCAMRSGRNSTYPDSHARLSGLLLRCVIGFNILLIALSWSSGFEGTENEVGVADKLLGNFRVAGFRADFVWLLLSSIAVFLLFWFFLPSVRASRSAKINATLCAIEIVAFAIFIHHILVSGLLYFG